MTAFVTCRRVVKVYRVGDHEIVALRGIDFDMERGEMVAIIGPSGAGKSTLLNLLGGLDAPTAGQLMVDGLDLLSLKGRQLAAYRLKRVGFLWQQVERNLLSHRSALRNVTLPMTLAGMPAWKRVHQAHELLDAVGLREGARKHPAALSGGQQQRVALAVALANHPALLLADEPTGALDRHSAGQMMDLLHALRRRYDLTVLIATHDLAVASHADRVLTLRDGALGQELSGSSEEPTALDESGKIRLPQAARAQLAHTPRIAVEIRPEGVLLRSEKDILDDSAAALHDILPPDAPPQQPERHWRRLWRRIRRADRVPRP